MPNKLSGSEGPLNADPEHCFCRSRITSGKWLIHVSTEKVDEVWRRLSLALHNFHFEDEVLCIKVVKPFTPSIPLSVSFALALSVWSTCLRRGWTPCGGFSPSPSTSSTSWKRFFVSRYLSPLYLSSSLLSHYLALCVCGQWKLSLSFFISLWDIGVGARGGGQN